MKSEIDKVTILNGIRTAAKYQVKSHFIFAGNVCWYERTLRSVITEGMKIYNIYSVMVSVLSSYRVRVIPIKEVEYHCNGKSEDKNSIHDDLDSFFERLCLGEERDESTRTYFFPMLSEKEKELFEAKDEEFMLTLSGYSGSEVDMAYQRKLKTGDDKTTTEKRESKTKFIRGICFRQTFLIHNYYYNHLYNNHLYHNHLYYNPLYNRFGFHPNYNNLYFQQPETKIRKMN